jgi:FtsH-binding integral membrane protein
VTSFPSEQAEQAPAREVARLSAGLLGKIMGLLAFSLVFATVGGVVGAQLDRGWLLPLIIVEFGLIFAIQALREREGVNFVLLYAFAFVSGATIGPIVASYAEAGAGTAILQAAATTGVMTAGLSAYALTTKRDLRAIRPLLMIALAGLLVAMLVSLFTGGAYFRGAISWGGALIFSGLLLIDVNRARSMPDTMGNAVVLTLGIYLDIVNLFLFLLRIFGGSGGRR